MLKMDNGDEKVNKELTIFLEIKRNIHNLLLLYAYMSNSLPEHINQTILMIVRSMALDYTNILT
jgi:hypothetical protein